MQKVHGALKFEATPSEVQGSLFTDIHWFSVGSAL